MSMARTGLDTTAVRQLRRRLDRRVLQARGLLVLCAAGRIGLAAAAAWATSGLVPRFASAVGLSLQLEPIRSFLVPMAAIAMTWWTTSGLVGQWPSRLTVALAAEAGNPGLGERISSAIDFLDDGLAACGGETAAASGRDGSSVLRQMAVAAAAEVSAEFGRVALPNAKTHLLTAAAGLAAIGSITIWERGIDRPPAPDQPSAIATRGLDDQIEGQKNADNDPSAGPTAGASKAEISRQTAAFWRRIERLRTGLDPADMAPLDAAILETVGGLAAEAGRAAAVAPEGRAAVLVGFATGLGTLSEDLGKFPLGTGGEAGIRLRVCQSLDPLLSLARAAAGIADAAAFERQLAGLTAEWFPTTAGERAADLTAANRERLWRMAALEDACTQALAHDRRMLVTAAGAGVGPLADVRGQLDAIEPRTGATADAIRSNRLALASQLAGEQAASLERAASILGIEPFTETVSLRLRPAAGPTTGQQGSAILDRLATGDGSDITAVSMAGDRVDMADSAAAGPLGRSNGAIGDSGRGAGRQTSAGDDGRVSSAVDGSIEPKRTTDRVGRVWSLLPPTSFPQRPEAEECLAFPSHRIAIDAYYQALYESLGRRSINQTNQPTRPTSHDARVE